MSLWDWMAIAILLGAGSVVFIFALCFGMDGYNSATYEEVFVASALRKNK